MSKKKDVNCRHFTGLFHDHCQAGITYKSVQDPTRIALHEDLPCFSSDGAARCPHYQRYTPEEIAAQQQEVVDWVTKFSEMLQGNVTTCLHCDQPVDHLEKVGRCVYARPCGCRQYQGRLPQSGESGEE